MVTKSSKRESVEVTKPSSSISIELRFNIFLKLYFIVFYGNNFLSLNTKPQKISLKEHFKFFLDKNFMFTIYIFSLFICAQILFLNVFCRTSQISFRVYLRKISFYQHSSSKVQQWQLFKLLFSILLYLFLKSVESPQCLLNTWMKLFNDQKNFSFYSFVTQKYFKFYVVTT